MPVSKDPRSAYALYMYGTRGKAVAYSYTYTRRCQDRLVGRLSGHARQERQSARWHEPKRKVPPRKYASGNGNNVAGKK